MLEGKIADSGLAEGLWGSVATDCHGRVASGGEVAQLSLNSGAWIPGLRPDRRLSSLLREPDRRLCYES